MKKLLILLLPIFVLACDVQQPVIEAPQEASTIPTFALEEATIEQLQKGYQNGEYSIQEITQQYLDRIEAVDKNGPSINSVMQINPDALSIAKQLDEELKAGLPLEKYEAFVALQKDGVSKTLKKNKKKKKRKKSKTD